jgi:hypothetical protein
MKTRFAILAVCAALAMAGCSHEDASKASGPVAGTVQLDGLTPEQKIQKIQNDPQIPEQYKQTYINSVRGQMGQPPVSSQPAPGQPVSGPPQ